jgi:hypothetical protein
MVDGFFDNHLTCSIALCTLYFSDEKSLLNSEGAGEQGGREPGRIGGGKREF